MTKSEHGVVIPFDAMNEIYRFEMLAILASIY
jgi:hypothetical protein